MRTQGSHSSETMICSARGVYCKLYHVLAGPLSLSTYEANVGLDLLAHQWGFAPGAATTSTLDTHLHDAGLMCVQLSKLEKWSTPWMLRMQPCLPPASIPRLLLSTYPMRKHRSSTARARQRANMTMFSFSSSSTVFVLLQPSFLCCLRADPFLHHLAAAQRRIFACRRPPLPLHHQTQSASVDSEAMK